jgi:hypothetical protein
VDALFGPFGDSDNLDARYVHDLCQMYHSLKSFWTHPMELLDDVAHVESYFGQLRDVLVSDQDGCIVCPKRTIGTEIVLDAPHGTAR